MDLRKYFRSAWRMLFSTHSELRELRPGQTPGNGTNAGYMFKFTASTIPHGSIHRHYKPTDGLPYSYYTIDEAVPAKTIATIAFPVYENNGLSTERKDLLAAAFLDHLTDFLNFPETMKQYNSDPRTFTFKHDTEPSMHLGSTERVPVVKIGHTYAGAKRPFAVLRSLKDPEREKIAKALPALMRAMTLAQRKMHETHYVSPKLSL